MKHLMYPSQSDWDGILRRLTMLSITILCLSVSTLIGFHLGVSNSSAESVLPASVAGIVAVAEGSGGQLIVLNTSGETWGFDTSGGWDGGPAFGSPPPVPFSEILFWYHDVLITTSGDGYYSDGTNWTNAGPVPNGTTGVDATPTTWGQLKNKYQETGKDSQ